MVFAARTAGVSEEVEKNGPPHHRKGQHAHSAQNKPPNVPALHATILLNDFALSKQSLLARRSTVVISAERSKYGSSVYNQLAVNHNGRKNQVEVCPTETINAPVEHIWELLTDPRQFARWSGARLEEGPVRPVCAGDHFVLKKRGMRIRIEVLSATPLQRLGLFIQLPFGIVNHEQVQLTQLTGTACRVTFN